MIVVKLKFRDLSKLSYYFLNINIPFKLSMFLNFFESIFRCLDISKEKIKV